MRQWLASQLPKLTLVPVVLLFLVVIIDLVISLSILKDSEFTDNAAMLAEKTSALVHEMQKERGMSAGYIGSQGQKFVAQIKQQRQLTDNRQKALFQAVEELDLNAQTLQALNTLKTRMNQMASIRSGVDSLNLPLERVLSYYTQNNTVLLDLNGELGGQIDAADSSKRFQALYNLAYAKEQAGIERAVLNNVFARDAFTPQLFVRFVQLKTKQQTFLQVAQSAADEKFESSLTAFMSSPEQKEVEKYRQIATDAEGPLGQSAEQWFAASTARINKLKQTEETLLTQIITFAQQSHSWTLVIVALEIVLLVIVLAVAYLVYSTIRIRARQAADIKRVMTAVDQDKDLTQTVQIISQDELGEIARLINVTFEHVKQDFTQFLDDASVIASSSHQTASAVEQSKANLIQLEDDITSIAGAIEQLGASIVQVVENVRAVSDNASKAAGQSQVGEKAVKVAVAGIENTATEIANVGSTIEQLNDKVSDILNMVDVIKSVAEQTNLLALNAAIEAARAGEQGRGFAVVADEVRSLAQRTQSSTKEISNVVDVLRTNSQSAFDSIAASDAKAKDAVSQANDVTLALGAIVSEIALVDRSTESVKVATTEQGDVVKSINRNINSIDQQAHENVVGAEQIASASHQLSEVADQMQTRLQRYKVS